LFAKTPGKRDQKPDKTKGDPTSRIERPTIFTTVGDEEKKGKGMTPPCPLSLAQGKGGGEGYRGEGGAVSVLHSFFESGGKGKEGEKGVVHPFFARGERVMCRGGSMPFYVH